MSVVSERRRASASERSRRSARADSSPDDRLALRRLRHAPRRQLVRENAHEERGDHRDHEERGEQLFAERDEIRLWRARRAE